jgi:dihydroorotate dehydrogenase (NAD+) catalytic subunit
MPKVDLILSHPLMNAAGILGFAPDPHGPVEIANMGAFITNPVSLSPRNPAGGNRLLNFSGGFLLHTGYPNPGLNMVLQHYAGQWARSPLPVLVHLLAQEVAEVSKMVRRLEGVEGVMGVELGLPPGVTARSAIELIRAALGELPVVVRIPLEQVNELAPIVLESGAAATSLAPPRGALPTSSNDRVLTITRGRLYGPAIFPLALAAVQILAATGIPTIGAGGIYHQKQVDNMLAAGAQSVQLDAVLWRGGF